MLLHHPIPLTSSTTFFPPYLALPPPLLALPIFPTPNNKSTAHMGDFVQLLRSKILNLLPVSHLLLALLLYFSAVFIVVPTIADVTMSAVCPGLDECSEAIYLTGLQQVITGVGTMIATPILGQLSDKYGRKPLLLIPFIMSIIPSAVLSYSRTKEFFYIYFVLRTLVSVVTEGSVQCISVAFVADTVEDHLRGSTYGVLGGVISVGFVLSIFSARILSEAYVFKVATVLSVLATLYLKTFLVETSNESSLIRGTRREQNDSKVSGQDSKPTILGRSCFRDIFGTFDTSPILVQVTIISFFSSLGEEGLRGTLFYYLKATFQFRKDEFSELMLLSGVTAVVSQLILMPFLVPILGEKWALCIGLFANFGHALLNGIAWTRWVPYLATSTTALSVFIFPSILSIVSKEAGPEEQGKLQGLISGVRSFAAIISPFAISPLTALFLSDNPPFSCKGFGIICAAVAMVIALIQGCLMSQPAPHISTYKPSGYMHVPSSSASEREGSRESSPLLGV